jgi:hypothetical protein
MASKSYKKNKQQSIENKVENQNKHFSAEQFWESYLVSKKSIADGQTFSDSIDEKSAGNLNLYYFDAI